MTERCEKTKSNGEKVRGTEEQKERKILKDKKSWKNEMRQIDTERCRAKERHSENERSRRCAAAGKRKI